MMRIAYVSTDAGVPPFGHKGCSVHVREVVGEFLRRGLDVTLFTARPEGERPDSLRTVPVHRITAPKANGMDNTNDAIETVIDRHGPFDIVYERHALWSHAPMEFARRIGIPGLLEVNAPLIEEEQTYRGLTNVDAAIRSAQRAFTAAGGLLAVSEEIARFLRHHGHIDDRVRVIPNGVDVDRFRPAPLETRHADRPFTIGFVGSMKPWHGLDSLIDAFRLLQASIPGARLLLIGDGKVRGSLQDRVLKLGLQDAVQCTGAVSPDAVPRLLQRVDVAVAPYPALENFYFSPLKVFEYMAVGLPVVASAMGDLRQLITHGQNGLLVPPDDPSALARELRRLHDAPSLRHRIGVNASRLVAASHSWSAVVDQILRCATGIKAVPHRAAEPQEVV